MEASTTTAVDAATRDFQALQRRDAAGMAAAYADDAVVDMVPMGIFRGSSEIRELFEGLFAAVPDLETTYEIAATNDDTVVVEWRNRGTFNGSAFQGIEPTGKQVEMRGVDVIKVKDDRIVHNTAYYDGMDFARQLGMLPPLGSSAEATMKKAFNASTKLRARLKRL
jgi:steroid delta-isomerase-like uncharacterized protein